MTHPTKPRFVAAAAGGVVQTWDLLTHSLVGDFCLPTPTPITAVAFSHDGTILAIGSSMGVVRLCRETDSELIADFRPVKQVTSPSPLPQPPPFLAFISTSPPFPSPLPHSSLPPLPSPCRGFLMHSFSLVPHSHKLLHPGSSSSLPPLPPIPPFPPRTTPPPPLHDSNAAASKAYMLQSRRAVTMQAV